MRDMSVTEQRYQALLGVISEGWAIMEVAGQWGVDRRTVHRWCWGARRQALELMRKQVIPAPSKSSV
ncbi:MAG TPA: helix-turn-helix domain-containing protein [Candidatus Dormibacteraeota bacterium]|nr:helix-turn-helix domain-containing protein [Candidatus Dormibacteraeota bacterium]